jgi:hypothetical protein
MGVQDIGMDQSSVSVVLVGYDSSRRSMSEPREVLTFRCKGGHLYAPGRHERGIIQRHPNILTRERISCLALLGK